MNASEEIRSQKSVSPEKSRLFNGQRLLLITLLLFLFSITVFSQEEQSDSLLRIVRSEVHDTTRIIALYDLLNYVPINECEAYNNQMLSLLQQLLSSQQSNYALKIRFLPFLAEAYYNKGVFLSNRNVTDSALIFYEKAHLLYKFIRDDQMIAYVEMSMAIIYTTGGEYEKAIELLYQSLKIHEKTEDFEGIGDTYMHIGRIYHIQKEYEDALKFTKNALNAYEKVDYKLGITEALYKLGIIELDMLHTDEAINFFTQCYNSSTNLDPKDKARQQQIINTCLGYMAYHNYQYDSAIVYFNKSVEFARLNKETFVLANRYLNLARTYLVIKDYENANRYGNLAYQSAIETNNLDAQYDALFFLSSVYKITGNYKNAFTALESYLEMHDSIHNADQNNAILKQQIKYEFEKKQLIENAKHEQALNKIAYHNERKAFIRNMVFILLALLIIVIAIITIMLIKHQKQKTIIEKQKANLYKQKMLKMQMNPHFIFNIINSIQNFVLQNNGKDAYSYLAKFSKLMRMVLNNSDKDVIELHEEIDLLKTYVNIEQLRFDNAFEFILEVDKDINEQEIFIPPMLLQPFIENAIWHGLMNLGDERMGILRVTFTKESNRLKVNIEDNGIGRERAMAYKKENHKSVAINLTQERMQIMDYFHKKDSVSFRFYDLFNEKHEVEGTGIEIFLPLNSVFENSDE